MAQGTAARLARKEVEIAEPSYYRGREEYSGLAVDKAKRLTELERKNARLGRLVPDLLLEKQVLKRAGCQPVMAFPLDEICRESMATR